MTLAPRTTSREATDQVFPYLRRTERPKFLIRFDRRHPDEIFETGFTARGHLYDIARHVHGGQYLAQTGFISTGASIVAAMEIFKGSLRYEASLTPPEKGSVRFDTWLYRMQSTKYVASVADNLLDPARKKPEYATRDAWYYAQTQKEWAVPRKISRETITMARKITLIVDLPLDPTRPFDLKLPIPPSIVMRARVQTHDIESPLYNPNYKHGYAESTPYNPFTDTQTRYDGLWGYQANVPPGHDEYQSPPETAWTREREYWNTDGTAVPTQNYPFGHP
ncbi:MULTISPECIES: hypothetical protein [Streptomyces]|uniref:Uncharacterized protein n=1 Tax=Streptomyces ehimensis TaxID=68195 RepID=A0ABV9BW87_9ACTN